jgi:hypothetical protein
LNKLLRLLVLIGTLLSATMAAVAYWRSGRSGEPFGACLRDVAGEWSLPSVRERARLAAVDGLRAMALRETAAERDLAATGPAATGPAVA